MGKNKQNARIKLSTFGSSLFLQFLGNFPGKVTAPFQGYEAIGGQRFEALFPYVVVGRVVPNWRGFNVGPSHEGVVHN